LFFSISLSQDSKKIKKERRSKFKQNTITKLFHK
jgi:hypothetical protein